MSHNEHTYTSSDGLKLYYRSYGEGPAVICIPGLTRNCKDFESLAEHLADRYRVITPDLRGRGQSDRDPKWRNYNHSVYARDGWELMDAAGVERAAIIGTSLGGLMAMNLASQVPERLRGIVLNDIGPEVAPEGLQRILAYAGRQPPVASWDEAAQQAREALGIAFPNADDDYWAEQARRIYRENKAGRPELDMDPMVCEAPRKAMTTVKWLTRFRRWGLIKKVGGIYIDPWDAFKSVTMPCLLVRGAISDIINAEIVERMRAVKPDLRTVEVPDRGHAPNLDEPEARQAIDEFLGSLDD
ncbi:MAG: alpha/beta hydrolase [Xanthomonadales bacterium]|nr:alpha/beta hydrolase [Xanthomonadales bacterium]